MAQNFLQAAEKGDTKFLIEKLSHTSDATNQVHTLVDGSGNNIFHIAVLNDREDFVREAVERVPSLVSGKNNQGRNPLHLAAEKGHLGIVKILGPSNSAPLSQAGENVAVYIPGQQPPPPEWIEKDLKGATPFLVATKVGHKEVALYLLDHFESMCDTWDNDGYSPLYHAIQHGWEDITLRMLDSKIKLSEQPNFRNPLSVVPYCSEKVFKKLLEEYQELAERCNEHKENFLHEWLSDDKCPQTVNALNWLLQLEDTVWSKGSKKSAICHVNNFGDNPLHIASRVREADDVRLLIEICSQEHGQNWQPWLQQNNSGDTPLLTALRVKKVKVALRLLKDADMCSQCRTSSNLKESPLFLAVQNSCFEVAKTILEKLQHDATLHTGPNGQNPMHVASSCPGIENYMTRYYSEWAGSKDEKGNTPLDNAAKAGDTNLIAILMQCCAVDKDDKAWIKAQAIVKLVSGVFGTNGFKELYKQQTDTPLHHINLMTKEGYAEFLSRPGIEILKDSKDKKGATPLHRAIEQNNKDLVEVLLSKDVDMTIKDKSHTRAFDLLAIRCQESQDWEAMCKQKGLHPYLSLSYIHSRTNLEQMRGTMAIVAALLATITFAAGIQIPGGFDEKTGYANHATKPAFIVFLISDTVAMCFSLLVLFFLIWTLSFSPTESLILMDLSVKLLQASLVATLVAFMTGVYVVVPHDKLWLAVLVIVLCAIVPFIAFSKILLILINCTASKSF